MNTGYAITRRLPGSSHLHVRRRLGSKVFTTRSYYFWISLVADSLGGVRGADLYRELVEVHHPQLQSSLL
ncbi:hypothetical protein PF005_g15247 [Phytophthora fragariae]|uniref:Uncharacterized protein n=1 Tax=Phytophthora fragariae TaxID=53985 RepID=A0A6A3YAN0_9STRA|nr:hypothetical protein PF003_g30439 [Phytophthora fragariae]KAE8935325.1 hypothetical protein PF009_g14726 [Phytophthora fragariae]KAE9006267.1 hypothetical protein PF011_g11664 [Phytophthora fragariae]KAE9093314.1 hypothetical protein PF010_g17527 [Phytophthora fragariae]KAE9104742.1 hypothetical protein PF007_g13948 [Phytophthora fragariae]